jgi:hypothetical protein
MNRLGVALWLVGPTTRSPRAFHVNRLWAQLFGTGIVETQEDFGTMGQPPSHPELLDWLATEFQQDLKWDQKALLKLLVTSATYRQSSVLRPEVKEKDPLDRLLARFPRKRIEAEMVRDQALAVSGLLSHKMLGPSGLPAADRGVVAGGGFNGERTLEGPATARDKYRRASTFLAPHGARTRRWRRSTRPAARPARPPDQLEHPLRRSSRSTTRSTSRRRPGAVGAADSQGGRLHAGAAAKWGLELVQCAPAER